MDICIVSMSWILYIVASHFPSLEGGCPLCFIPQGPTDRLANCSVKWCLVFVAVMVWCVLMDLMVAFSTVIFEGRELEVKDVDL